MSTTNPTLGPQWTLIAPAGDEFLYARLQRLATTGAAPASDPWVTMLQAHLECDTMGSRTPTAK